MEYGKFKIVEGHIYRVNYCTNILVCFRGNILPGNSWAILY